MSIITDFYQFKYSKDNYYLELYIERNALVILEDALREMLCNLYIPRDSQCAYMRLMEQFEDSRKKNDSQYVQLKINKFYLKYLENLYNYFFNRIEYGVLKVISDYTRTLISVEGEEFNRFITFNEDIKIRILSNI